MNNLRGGMAALVIVLAVGTAVYAGPPVVEGGAQIVRYDVVFDGYCDGFAGIADLSTGLIRGDRLSSCALRPRVDTFGGTVGTVSGQGFAIHLSWDPRGPDRIDSVFTVVRADGTWTHFRFDGSVHNAGTWSSCVADDGSPVEVPVGTGSSMSLP